ncbi:MAG: SpoIIE family protein phosphatase [Myxococcales bacterium]|nr:MAG: SpoIIE family protein phosphatase [Myxococcales bacterium]
MLGTLGFGLATFDMQTKKVELVLGSAGSQDSDYIYKVYKSPFTKNRFWIGTLNAGLLVWNTVTNNVSHFLHDEDDDSSLSNNTVTSVVESGGNEVWIGTDGGGLNKFDPQTEKFERVGLEAGLEARVINEIAIDDTNTLWLATSSQGLVRYNPENRSLMTFDSKDGALDEYNQGAGFMGKSGRIFFGGIDGFIRFDPHEIHIDTSVPTPIITSFLIRNKIAQTEKPIWETSHIEMSYRDAYFEAHLAALSFGNPQRNVFSHRLVGLHDEWVKSKSSIVSYSRLEPGRYTLEIRASNRHGVWSKKMARLSVVVAPPPWKSWWAYLTYGIVILLILFEITRRQREKFEEARRYARLQDAERELELTAVVQSGLLPEKDFIENINLSIQGFYRPAEKCSGDWWWYEQHGRNITKVAVGDVSGHGAGPAMVTAAVAAAFRVTENEPSLPIRLNKIDEEIYKVGRLKYHMTLTVLDFLNENNKVCLYSAGGLPALLLPYGQRKTRAISVPSNPLGYLKCDIGIHSFEFNPGDRLLLFTDGIVETKGEKGREYGIRGISKLLEEYCELPIQQSAAQLVARLDSYRAERPQQDDWTFVIAERPLVG